MRKTGMDDPDMGNWEYEYDALGNLTTQADARGCSTSLSYDDLSRLVGKSYSGTCGQSTAAVSYGYDGITHQQGFEGSSVPAGWSAQGNVTFSNGQAHVIGSGSWGTNIKRIESVGDQVQARFSFKASSTSALAYQFLHSGTYGQSNYRRWSIGVNGGYLVRMYYQGTSYTSVNLIP